MEMDGPADSAADRHQCAGDDLMGPRAERCHSIWFIQVVGREIRWTDYYENSGFGLEHYVQELKKRREQHGSASATITFRMTSTMARSPTARAVSTRW